MKTISVLMFTAEIRKCLNMRETEDEKGNVLSENLLENKVNYYFICLIGKKMVRRQVI